MYASLYWDTVEGIGQVIGIGLGMYTTGRYSVLEDIADLQLHFSKAFANRDRVCSLHLFSISPRVLKRKEKGQEANCMENWTKNQISALRMQAAQLVSQAKTQRKSPNINQIMTCP
jgi:hypothetical protein